MKWVKYILLLLFFTSTLLGDSKVTPTGLKLIKHYESLRLHSYLDAVNVWTIGWGTTKNVGPNMTINVLQADILLINDVHGFENYVNKKIQREMKWYEFDASVSFTYNVGHIDGSMRNAINARNTKLVSYYFKKYVTARIRGSNVRIVLPGLVKRRNTEAKLYESGKLEFK